MEERRDGAAQDGTVKFVPPLEPLAVRVISPRCLSEDERVQIANPASRGRGRGPTAIGQLMGPAPSTISLQLRRNPHPSGSYRPFHAHAAAASRRRRAHPLKLIADPVLKAYVVSRLRERCRPRRLRLWKKAVSRSLDWVEEDARVLAHTAG